MTIEDLKQLYKDKNLTPRVLLTQIRERIETHSKNPIWIHVLDANELEPYLARLE